VYNPLFDMMMMMMMMMNYEDNLKVIVYDNCDKPTMMKKD
jgi:hypothetical protein